MIGRNDPCWCGSNKKWKKCHFPDEGNTKRSLAEKYGKQYGIRIKTEEEIAKIRAACKVTKEILDKLCKASKIGVTTNELNDYANQLYKEAGTIPATLNYGDPPYPKSICTSLNEVICHGIPNDIPLKEGDIMNIDVSCILDGFFGDCSRMVTIGKVSEEKQLVVEVAHNSLMRAIVALGPGVPLSKIGEVIEEYALSRGCTVVYQFVGHGVGIKFHEPPQILHYRNSNHMLLIPGMIFTIEPMINAGVPEGVIDPDNLWEARTKDGKPSAQEEHTILITETGHEILTL